MTTPVRRMLHEGRQFGAVPAARVCTLPSKAERAQMFTVIYNNAAGILRALSRADIPFRILLVSCGTNIVLDALFVGIFRWNIVGVGIATVISQALSATMAYHSINQETQEQCFSLYQMRMQGGKIIAEAMCIGMAASVQSALIGFSNIFVVRYMNWLAQTQLQELAFHNALTDS